MYYTYGNYIDLDFIYRYYKKLCFRRGGGYDVLDVKVGNFKRERGDSAG
jgi:hypothetical protein